MTEYRRLLVIGFIFFLSLVAEAQNHESSFAVVRVRLLKELSEFPLIPHAKVKAMSPVIWTVEGSHLEFQNKKLSTKNFVIKKENGKYDLIALFNFNTYLAGVVSKEMPLNWPLEALKAQAVVARSFALARMNERKNKVYHLDTDQMDQVFALTSSEKAQQAVALTDQIILKDHKNRVVKAFYHADCGGQTVPASKVWADSFDTGTAVDPWCLARRSNEWVARIPKQEFYQKMMLEAGMNKAHDGAIEVSERYRDRIQTFSLKEALFSVQKLRQIFGFSFVRNSPMSFSETESLIEIKGKGYGHGAGLCQWGTMAQAKKGRSFTQILEHYYPQAVISQEQLKISKNMLSDLVFN